MKSTKAIENGKYIIRLEKENEELEKRVFALQCKLNAILDSYRMFKMALDDDDQ